jgi:hypothetical protein
MAAAADRLSGDALERVSPELVLVDATLGSQARERLPVPDDTLTRLGRHRIEAPAIPLQEPDVVEVDTEPSPAPHVDADLAEHESGTSGIEDLLVRPAEERPSEAESKRRSYPALPTPPPGTGYSEDATEAVLRHIREHLEVDATPARASHRALSVTTVVAALGSIALLIVDGQLELYELPRLLGV